MVKKVFITNQTNMIDYGEIKEKIGQMFSSLSRY